jgi:hypothetical protein
MSEPFETDVPTPHRDRREHGGAPVHPDDDAAETRLERDRVEAGVSAYDDADVPPATDDPVPFDPSQDTVVDDIVGIGARQEDEGETVPLTEDNPFPPTRYAEQ